MRTPRNLASAAARSLSSLTMIGISGGMASNRSHGGSFGIGMTTELVRGDVFYWGALMGGALIASIPVAVIYTFFLDRFIAGFTVGAIK